MDGLPGSPPKPPFESGQASLLRRPFAVLAGRGGGIVFAEVLHPRRQLVVDQRGQHLLELQEEPLARLVAVGVHVECEVLRGVGPCELCQHPGVGGREQGGAWYGYCLVSCREHSPAVGAAFGNEELVAGAQQPQHGQVVDAATRASWKHESRYAAVLAVVEVAVLYARKSAVGGVVWYLQPGRALAVAPRGESAPGAPRGSSMRSLNRKLRASSPRLGVFQVALVSVEHRTALAAWRPGLYSWWMMLCSSASHRHASLKSLPRCRITKSIVPPDAPQTKHLKVLRATLNERLGWRSSWKGHRLLCRSTCSPSRPATPSMGSSRSCWSWFLSIAFQIFFGFGVEAGLVGKVDEFAVYPHSQLTLGCRSCLLPRLGRSASSCGSVERVLGHVVEHVFRCCWASAVLFVAFFSMSPNTWNLLHRS